MLKSICSEMCKKTDFWRTLVTEKGGTHGVGISRPRFSECTQQDAGFDVLKTLILSTKMHEVPHLWRTLGLKRGGTHGLGNLRPSFSECAHQDA